MSIIRIAKETNFSVIHNGPLRDERLSWGARGIIAYLLSKPDGWEVDENELINSGTSGRDAVRGFLKELKTFGYFKREKVRQPNGTFVWVQSLYEYPQADEAAPTAHAEPSEAPAKTRARPRTRTPQPQPQSTTAPTTDGTSGTGQPGTGQPGTGQPVDGPAIDGQPGDILNTELRSTETRNTEKATTTSTREDATPDSAVVVVAGSKSESSQKPRWDDRTYKLLRNHNPPIGAARQLASEPYELVKPYYDYAVRVGMHEAQLVENLRAGLHHHGPPAPPATTTPPPAPSPADDASRPAWIRPQAWAGLSDLQRQLLEGSELINNRIKAQFPDWEAMLYNRWPPMVERLVSAAKEATV